MVSVFLLYVLTKYSYKHVQMAVKNCFIRGSVVRYVTLPAEHVDTQLLEDATRRGTFFALNWRFNHFEGQCSYHFVLSRGGKPGQAVIDPVSDIDVILCTLYWNLSGPLDGFATSPLNACAHYWKISTTSHLLNVLKCSNHFFGTLNSSKSKATCAKARVLSDRSS
jgi:hypothetical protein